MPDATFWTAVGSIAAGIGLLLTAIGLCFAGYQLRQSTQIAKEAKKITQGEFLLHLEELLQTHAETHKRLRPGGEWSGDKEGPSNATEWVDVERYMGLFERISLLVHDKILDIEYVDYFYGYRLLNIVHNQVIHQAKLEGKAAAEWKGFIELWKQVEGRRAKAANVEAVGGR